jgi:glycine cleavage system H protein
MYPTDRRYAKEHEWILVQNGTATIGITDYAQEQLGDIVFVELPEVGRELKRGEVVGSVESVKAVSEIFAPIGGTVTEVNSDLDGEPETINSDAHGGGWYCKLTILDAVELDDLMDAEAYQKFIETEA